MLVKLNLDEELVTKIKSATGKRTGSGAIEELITMYFKQKDENAQLSRKNWSLDCKLEETTEELSEYKNTFEAFRTLMMK